MADNSARIAEIDAILETGAMRVRKSNGVEVEYDLDALRAERRRLQSSDDTVAHRRPRVTRIKLGGF